MNFMALKLRAGATLSVKHATCTRFVALVLRFGAYSSRPAQYGSSDWSPALSHRVIESWLPRVKSKFG